jgi:REP element-mobilizing transposase RayT
MIFHLVSRTHRREAWFSEELRSIIVELIRRMVARTDAQLLAYAVMPNHLHIVLRQGRMELAQTMQPLMRRVAVRVQRAQKFEGTVVERRFRDTPCASPDHVRSAIVYTHLNPWRAGLCSDDLAYPWTSHAAYLPGADPTVFGIDPEAQQRVLELFADEPHLDRDQLAERYRAHVRWCTCHGRYLAALESGHPATALPLPPSTAEGDKAWLRHFSPHERGALGCAPPLPDDFVRSLVSISNYDPGLSIGELRGSWVPRRLRGFARASSSSVRRPTAASALMNSLGSSPSRHNPCRERRTIVPFDERHLSFDRFP